MSTNRLENKLIGTILDGRYYLEEEIGKGGFATVYCARDTQFRVKKVAVKVLNLEPARQEEFRVRFKNEAMIAGQIDDENEHIVRVHDYGECDGRCYYVMEYLQGKSLRDQLGRHKPVPLQWIHALRIADQLCEALEVAHRHGIVHRDLKPENVFLVWRRGSEHVKLLDLGIAKVLKKDWIDASSINSLTGSIIGSAHYMAPEQIRSGVCDGRTDIYSLGVLMYELLTGHVPFASDNEYEVFDAHVNKEPPTFAALAPTISVPSTVEAIVRRAMAKESEERFADVQEMRRAIWVELSNVPLGRGIRRDATVVPLPTALRQPGPLPDELDGAKTQPRIDVSKVLHKKVVVEEPASASGPTTKTAEVAELSRGGGTTLRVAPPLSQTDPTPPTRSRDRKHATADHGGVRSAIAATVRRGEDPRGLSFGTWAGLCGLVLSALFTACPASAALSMVVWPEWIGGSREAPAASRQTGPETWRGAQRAALGANVGAAERAPSASVGAAERAPSASVGAVERAQSASVGAAERAQSASVGAAERAPSGTSTGASERGTPGVAEQRVMAATPEEDVEVAAVVATPPSAPEPEFRYETAKVYVREQHVALVKCMQGGKFPLKFTLRIDKDGNVRGWIVKHRDPGVRKCVRGVLSFGFDTSPRGGAFNYVLSAANVGALRPISLAAARR